MFTTTKTFAAAALLAATALTPAAHAADRFETLDAIPAGAAAALSATEMQAVEGKFWAGFLVPSSSYSGYYGSGLSSNYYYSNKSAINSTYQKQATMYSQGMSNSPYSAGYAFPQVVNNITRATISPNYAPIPNQVSYNTMRNDQWFQPTRSSLTMPSGRCLAPGFC